MGFQSEEILYKSQKKEKGNPHIFKTGRMNSALYPTLMPMLVYGGFDCP